MKITEKWLKDRNACENVLKYWEEINLPDSTDFIKHCIETNDKEKLQWANWLMVRVFKTKKKKVQYAAYATAYAAVYAAAYAAAAAAVVADADDAAAAAVVAAAYANAGYNKTLIKIIEYGLTL